MEKTIAIQEINKEVKDFLAMPQSIAKNILYHRQFQGNHFPCGNILIREDGTVHYSYTVYKISRGKEYFMKKNSHYGFTVDPKGKMNVWFGGKLHTIPYLHNVLSKLDKEWVKEQYLQFITNSVMGKIIAGKITNPHDLFTTILKLYRVKNASANYLKHAVEKNNLTKSQLLQGITVAKNLDHYLDFVQSTAGSFSQHGSINDLMQQALILDRKIDFNWSVRRMEEEHKKWTEELMELESDSMSREPLNWLKKFQKYNDNKYRLLDNQYDVFKEGKVMKHCVYTNYWNAIKYENFVVFHVNDGSTYGLTLGLTYDKTTGLHFNQLMGKFNQHPDSGILHEVKQWLNDINNYPKTVKNITHAEIFCDT